MKRIFSKGTMVLVAAWLLCLPTFLSPTYAQDQVPGAVKIVAPDGIAAPIYNQARPNAELIDMALNGRILECVKAEGDFLEVKLPDKGITGFVQKSHTTLWEPPKGKGLGLLPIIIGLLIICGAGAGAFFYLKSRKVKQVSDQSASIQTSVKRAEECFRSGEYGEAIREFNNYLKLQGGEVRNPDVYRRLTVCYKHTEDIMDAAQCWEKMRSLGGLKSIDDYTLGVELMVALGREAEAANIYEHLLSHESDEERKYDIHKKLFEMYRKLKSGEKMVDHAIKLRQFGSADTTILPNTVNFLIAENKSDLAIESGSKELITALCHEFVEDRAKTPEAGRIYLKCLEYDRTDQRLHRLLADIYNDGGDFRRAVSELTILQQIDKDQADQYLEEAAKIYVENSRVTDALNEGNPQIIKKIAQQFLVRSEVTPTAVAVYEKVLEIQPNAVGINKMLSTVYLTRGDLPKYVERLHVLHEIDGKNHDYLSDLAQCIIDNDLIDDTLKEGNRDLNARIMKQLIKRGSSNDQAVQLLEKVLKHDPQNVLIRGALVKAHERRQEYTKAMDQALLVVKYRSADEDSCGQAARIAVDHGLYDRIINCGNEQVLLRTAMEIVSEKITDTSTEKILKEALIKFPDQEKIRAHLKNLVGKPQIERQTEPERKPEAQKAAPVRASEESAGRPEPQRPPEIKKTEPVAPGKATMAKAQAKPPKEVLQAQPPSPKEIKQSDGIKGKVTQEVKPKTEMPPERKAAAAKAKTTQVGRSVPAPAKPAPKRAVEPTKVQPAENAKAKAPERPRRPISDTPPRDAVTKQEEPLNKAPQGPSPANSYSILQSVQISDPEVSLGEKAITTFVSGHSKGLANEYSREELFLPEAGGLAFKEMELLVSDGWGNLHIGVEVNTGRPVLMRVFKRFLLEPHTMTDFIKEISELGFNMNHENIMPIHEMVAGPGGVKGIVHPFFPQTLESVMTAKKRPELNVRLSLINQIVEGMHYAHNFRGVDGRPRKAFHLHLQPAQIVVSNDYAHIKITCLGYSQSYRNITRGKQPRFRDPGMNPITMPPEFFLARGGTIREKSVDVYSLGVLMYYLATGEYPFEGPSFDDYKFQHGKIFAAPPRLIDPAVPDWLEPIILGCLEKNPDKRWDSVAEIRQAFMAGFNSN